MKSSTKKAVSLLGTLCAAVFFVMVQQVFPELFVENESGTPTGMVAGVETEDAQSAPSDEIDATLARVDRVIDGDTIDVIIVGEKQRIRMIGLNTPESVDPRKPVECFGKEASAHLKELLEGKEVRLEGDETQGDTDKYGRVLRYVFLGGANINQQMIADGYGFEYTYKKPYRYQDAFRDAQKDASDKKRGLWSADTCSGAA